MRSSLHHRCLFLLIFLGLSTTWVIAQKTAGLQPLELTQVHIDDFFWSPKYKIWRSTTVYDVLNKLEGKYVPDRDDLIKEKEDLGSTRNAFLNFDRVASREVNTGKHDGPPWYDGLVYETIYGAADLLASAADKALEEKIDHYIDRIAAAQAVDPDGYLNTYTTLERPDQRWGTNGGDDRWQHDLYNAGMLIDAGVHYYRATGKTKLLAVSVKLTNYMCKAIGEAPKLNVIPGHAGPELALLGLYKLFNEEPDLKSKLQVPVHSKNYYQLAIYWIEHRGVYADDDGSRKRESYGSYNQDQAPVFKQNTIEGHAVRATLLATAIAAEGTERGHQNYIQTANRYWDNMIGKRTFLTGGEGAIAEDEKFGPDYYLPESAYLETCAAVGAAFFSEQMNQMQADGKYMDAFERALYNNILSGISLDGRHYYYENPLKATDHPRWSWHSCPCCPPMFLKMVGALPGYIYGKSDSGLYVNLFMGSKAEVDFRGNKIKLVQSTGYPWKGKTQIEIMPEKTANFTMHVRIPGWAMRQESSFGLYHCLGQMASVNLRVNGKEVPLTMVHGYAEIKRNWHKGDKIELELPMAPRLVIPDKKVETLKNKVAIAAGPLVYAVESANNSTEPVSMELTKTDLLKLVTQPLGLLGEMTMISVMDQKSKPRFKAIPFFAIGNNGHRPFTVWLNEK